MFNLVPKSTHPMEISPKIQEMLDKLGKKYAAMDQDLLSYLEGLLYSNSLSYWDYIHLDTLLSLQTPRTDFPDERIFIIYHQITELYFKLVKQELEIICVPETLTVKEWKLRLGRCVNYFRNLCNSFEVMIDGMEPAQFLKFRMSLLPASGFQSAQYRLIEFQSTNLINLVHNDKRDAGLDEKEFYENIYWKSSNIDLKTQKKTLTLLMFENKYDEVFRSAVSAHLQTNLYHRFLALPDEIRNDDSLRELMRDFDLFANVFWRLSHYRSAVKYLKGDPDVIAATGGTNWQEFLPPKFQRIIFFPDLWTAEEKADWGKDWVVKLFKELVEKNWGKSGKPE
jgi:tryptophan 2,3-dioxygenase